MATSSKRPEKNDEESATLPALTVEDDCVLHSCLERDSYDSGYCKTNEVFSVLINDELGWLSHKRTYAVNDPFPVKSLSTSMRNGVQLNALMVVVLLSDSPCSARHRGKGVSERSELAPCKY